MFSAIRASPAQKIVRKRLEQDTILTQKLSAEWSDVVNNKIATHIYMCEKQYVDTGYMYIS